MSRRSTACLDVARESLKYVPANPLEVVWGTLDVGRRSPRRVLYEA